MKQTIYILTLAFGLISCNNQTTEKAVDTNSVDTSKTVSADKQHLYIYIKDKSQYDQTFIDGLADYNEPIILIDKYIVTGKDTTYFPDDLVLNKPTTFAAIKDNNKYVLTVTRTNLTNLIYKFQLTDNDNKTLDTKSGKAILDSTFFFAPEGEPDPETGKIFVSNEYRMKNENFWLVIKIGMDKEYEGKKRSKIFYGQIHKSKMTEPTMESPILRTE
jgi:hypothetical protein